AVERFTAEHPQVELQIHFGSFLDPLAGLRENAADVAFLYGEFEHDGIELHYLWSEPRGLALAAGHPLARRPEVSIADFVREPLIEVPSRDPVWNDYWIAAEHRGREPARKAASVHTIDGLIEAIAMGLGVALSVEPAVEALGAVAGVVFRPVPGLAPLDVWVAQRQGDERPVVAAFCDGAVAALRTS
ncbi:MAG: LysR family substrate-binding domain-containing protein, partial [Solirubrobacterales bacterium]|nr:LysR family substrate-binding domain-containing protein [Solirubrobacterales bacterium]